ncbi:hypothetical protein NADFUDRAFT_82616 [Nadsonia fulvescens var. elongata DSM 6958]|uniref:Interferon-related developmental regulator N-terminal domain-containing protein n=1 Tax=Nadsonia fulvescens var. elongata DSM 6958 TaxID=857566 RepID=A0A1E3PJV7_9ASCO|nr:hypothetical protein NADFUDRAFT_82616 [Nadsonia fulvescens var. elongata DSM 6958]
MSDLKKQIAHAVRGESTTPRGGTPAESRSSSRLRGTTPSIDEYFDTGFFYAGDIASDPGRHSKLKDRFDGALEHLSSTRRQKTSSETRQNAVGTVVSMFRSHYKPELVTENNLTIVLNTLATANTDAERVLCIQALTLMAVTNIDAVTEVFLDNFLPNLKKMISGGNLEDDVRSVAVMAYALNQFLILRDSSGYGMEDSITFLMDLVTSSNSDEGDVASAAVLGIGLLVSCHESPNSIISENAPTLVETLTVSPPAVVNSIGKVLALFYEAFDYPDTTAEEEANRESDYDEKIDLPYYDTDDLLQILEDIVTASNKGVSKKVKQEQKPLFRDVIATIEDFRTSKSRRTMSEVPADEAASLAHLKVNKNKAIDVDTFAKLVRLQFLKWFLEGDLSTHLVANPVIDEIVEEASFENFILSKFEVSKYASEYDINEPTEDRYNEANIHDSDARKRTKAINKSRASKAFSVANSGEEVNV